MKIDPETAEKRLKRFAPPIKHDKAHYLHAFDHRGLWYGQRSAITAPTGLPVTGCSGPGNAGLFLRPRRAASAESVQIRYLRVVGSTAYF
jgi:hypothetical protein